MDKKEILQFRLPVKNTGMKSFKPKIDRDKEKDRFIELERGITVTINTDKEVEPTYESIRNLYLVEPDAIVEFNPPLYKYCDELGIHINIGNKIKRSIDYAALNLSYKEFGKKTGNVTDIRFNIATYEGKPVTIITALIDNDYIATAHSLIKTK